MTPSPRTRRTAVAVLAVLTVINFLNYLDRYVLSAVLEAIRTDLQLQDAQSGLLGTMFMTVYMLFAPLGGYLGDRVNRHRLAAVGVALWSLATVASGLAQNYEQLMLTRACVGIGEAGYATVAPSVIADLFRPHERGRRLAIFYLAIPLGSALGYLVGGWVGEHYGWRSAFFVAGAPGLLLAIAAALLPDPPRGAMDDPDDAPDPSRRVPFVAGVRALLVNDAWRTNTIGTTLMTFAMGGIAFWMPTYLVRAHDLSLSRANLTFGGLTVVAGLLATPLGGVLGDRAQARGRGGYLRLSGVTLLLGAPFALLMPFLSTPAWAFAFAFLAEFFLFLNTGPLNAALVGSVPAAMRASAVAINVLFIHLLGDAISPMLIGLLSDAANIGVAIAATAGPIAVAGLVLVVGAARLERAAAPKARGA